MPTKAKQYRVAAKLESTGAVASEATREQCAVEELPAINLETEQ